MKSILIVDDEAIICAELQRTLQCFGFDAKAAHSARGALRLIRKARFDVILVEFNLRSERFDHPRAGNGLQLVRQIRASQITVPILICSVMEGVGYETAALDAGADGFISKTAPIPILVSRLRAHIRRHNLSRKASPGVNGDVFRNQREVPETVRSIRSPM
jgi:two-component system OmpR family response regulator